MWGAIITVALKLLEWFLDRSKAKKEIMQRFYEFVKEFDKEGALKSVKLRESYLRQLEKLKPQTMEKPSS